MQRDGTGLRLAATDLANHLSCRHLTQLDRGVAEGRLTPPAWRDPALALLQQRGFAHERAFIDHLRSQGVEVVSSSEEGSPLSRERVLEAMRAGAGAIVQATLSRGRWMGRADILLRVEEPSSLGRWSYEVIDTKLAQETRAGTVLQLCLYSDIVSGIQGRAPEWMHVVKPGEGFEPESFRYADFQAYYRLVRRRLEEAVGAPASDTTYPYPVAHCDVCRWWRECDARRHADDNLCLVAGIRPLHESELERQGIRTLEQYAEEPAPVREKPLRGNVEAFTRVHEQARIQLEGRRAGRMVHELLPAEPDRGLTILPAPSAGDVFFDIESDPFVDDGGLEFLLGVATPSAYTGWWATDRAQERTALERFFELVMDRWARHPDMHVYHFTAYEPGAIKRLVGRYGIREIDLDRLLRAGIFVDLHSVLRHGVRVSVESYSLKAVEECYAFERARDLREAGSALRRIAGALEVAGAQTITNADREIVESYNRDDCLSAAGLRDWLEERRTELEKREGNPIPRPPLSTGEASEAVEQKASDVEKAFQQLTADLPADRSAWGPEERARWLLAHQLGYFRREDNCAWWEYFRVRDLDGEDLLDERSAIGDLRFEGRIGGSSRSPVDRYSFPPQEVAIQAGKKLRDFNDEDVGTVESIDPGGLTIDIEKKGRYVGLHPEAVMLFDRVGPAPVDKAFLALAVSAASHGVDGVGPFRAARDLLLRYRPRMGGPIRGPLRHKAEDIVTAAVRLVRSLDHGTLPIQGPPGTGKTYTGARMILALAEEGKRIGVTAVSHKVISNLLAEVRRAAQNQGIPIEPVHKVSRAGDDPTPGIDEVTDNGAAKRAVERGRVTGATCWFWSRDEMVDSVDYLFVDEAGQMSLAFALAAGRSARNVVLLGDPQQLEQPQRGAHPEGAEVAALVHVLGGAKTISDEAGLFLDVTWRLHPRICAFTSELFYEGRLRSHPTLARLALSGQTPFAGSGLYYVPVAHEGNRNSSPEEIEAVSRIVSGLIEADVSWTGPEGAARKVGPSDVMVVAPYNAQVAALSARLPGIRVGTVDRFQGQQAPVVIYSMASSSAVDAPRGMSFLYSPNRLNVATSRAQCACILVASPRVLEPECGTPDQMRWANALCRYRELAKEVTVGQKDPGPGRADAAR